jgi:hypothetical protein
LGRDHDQHQSPRQGVAEILAVHERLPCGVSPADNESGWRLSLDKLAALVEAD